MFKFPFGTMNELNLNWIIQKVKDLADAAGITKEKLSFLTPNGTETFDGSEPLTIDVQGVDTSGKLDKYEGGTDSIYGTLGSTQVNFPVPLPANRGGTGVTNLPDLETSMNLPGKYVARKTTAGGLYAYGHNGNTEQEIPVEVSPAPAGIPYRDANSCVKTGTPQTDNDSATKKYTDDALALKEDAENKATTIAADDETSTTKFPAIKAIVDWCKAKFVQLSTTANESVYSHTGNTQGEIATTTANTPDTIVKRNAQGTASFSDPVNAQEPVTLNFYTASQNRAIRRAFFYYSSAAVFGTVDVENLPNNCLLLSAAAYGSVHTNNKALAFIAFDNLDPSLSYTWIIAPESNLNLTLSKNPDNAEQLRITSSTAQVILEIVTL